MHGLIRVRQFTISEAHLIIRPDQLEEEFKACIELANFMLETLGLKEDCYYQFSRWDPANEGKKYQGTAEQWEKAESAMQMILDNLDLDYKVGIDEAAFYGPKLDIQFRNVFGKEDTLITIQIDMLLAQQFGMQYTDSNNEMQTPYIIHRTSIGCYERTLALLIEKYGGALPTWMAPEQVRVLPITDRVHDYAEDIADALKEEGYRVTVDDRSEKVGKKIREAQVEKIPFMLIVGDKERENGHVSVRHRAKGDIGVMPQKEFLEKLRAIVDSKSTE